MGLGKILFGGGGGKTSSSVSIPKWLQSTVEPLYKQAGTIGGQIANQAYSQYDGPRVAMPEGDFARTISRIQAGGTQPIYKNIGGFANGMVHGYAGYRNNNDAYNKSKAYTSGVLGGKFMSGNPYLQGVIDKGNRSISNSYNTNIRPQMEANLARQGAFGGSSWLQANNDINQQLAQALSENDSTNRFNDYNNERGYMQQAVGDAAAQQGQDYQTFLGNQAARERGAALGLAAQGQQDQALGQAFQAGSYLDGQRQKQYDINNENFNNKRDWLFRALSGLQGGLGITGDLYGQSGKSTPGSQGLVGNIGSIGKMFGSFGL